MNIHPYHSFDLTVSQMQEIQRELRRKIQETPDINQPKIVCGVDLSYWEDQAVAVITAMDYDTKKIIETITYTDTVSHEYIPGFLAFRELPLFLKAWEQLKLEPDIVFFDGNGMLHPQRAGLATHASFFIQKPTIGIAKNHFIGTYDPPGETQGSYEYIRDQGEIIGAVLRTQTGIKPVYVSVGNQINLSNAIDLTMHFVGRHSRIPEITRQPDLLSKKIRRELQTIG